jgi:hypothetical protein
MVDVVPFSDRDEAPVESVDADRQRFVDAIKLLLRALPPEEQERILQEIIEAVRPVSLPKAGQLLGAIIQFLPRRKNWTVEAIKQEIASRGISAKAKEIYNSLGYLTRKGRIRRVGYGRYLVEGALLETADDLGLPPARDEED